jgi:hypothetical protein
MTDAIAQNELGQHRFVARREPGWHQLGTVFQDDLQITPEEATIMSHCDYFVRKIPLTLPMPDGTILQTEQVALVKEPENAGEKWNQILGYASSGFEVVQNMEVASWLSELGKQWPVETVGALGNGETYFVTLKSESATVAGEEIAQYLLVSNNHDGKRALHVALTPVRVVCQNTLATGLAAAVLSAALPHRSTIRDEAKFSIDLIASVRRQQAAMIEQFSALAKIRVTDDDVKQLLEQTYPDPQTTRKQRVASFVVNDQTVAGLVNDNKVLASKILADHAQTGSAYEAKVARTQKLREMANERIGLVNTTAPTIAGTAWAAYQGITEVENYRGNANKGTATSILFGERAATMARAYKSCVALIG